MFEDIFGIDSFTGWLFTAVIIIILIFVFSSFANSEKENRQESTSAISVGKTNER